VAGGLAAAIAEATTGYALGRVEVMPGEAPILTSFAARRDAAAAAVVSVLTAGVAHRRPALWLVLPRGSYLGTVVRGDRPFAPEPAVVAALVSSGRAVRALLTEATPAGTDVALRLEAYARPGELLAALRLCRRQVAEALRRAASR